MLNAIGNIPWSYLIIAAVLLGTAPLGHTPHLIEKIGLLYEGNLKRPIDIFDLFLHASPFILMAVKAYLQFVRT
ncbi:MAG: hypothetical protein HZA04_05085 [Nitrospinae bacterium]|nr:hypothetical protein [Nitrospinota bacterium]